jgi:glycosyltransferase involved in cell wall biosynthesis
MVDASIIIPTYNRGHLLDYSLKSLLNQRSGQYSYEVIIVDDGSSDNTKTIIDRYRNYMALKYYYQGDRGYRVSKARNIGIINAEGEINIFIDSGMLASTEFVRRHCDSHRNQRCAVIGNIYGFLATLDDKLFFELFNFDDIDKSIDDLKKVERFGEVRRVSYKSFNNNLAKTPAPWFYFWAGNISVKKEDLINVGLFDETFNSWGVEDLELGFRLFQKNIPIILNSHAEAIHHPHDNYSKVRSAVSNTAYFHEKHHCIESEMFLCSKRYALNENILDLWENEINRFDYNNLKLKSTEIFNFLNNKCSLLIGAHNGALLQQINFYAALEYHKINYQSLVKQFPDQKIYNSLGAKTSFGNKQFEIILIADCWKLFPKKWLINIINESQRIGRETFLILDIMKGIKKVLDIEEKKRSILAAVLSEMNLANRILETGDGNLKARFIHITDEI